MLDVKNISVYYDKVCALSNISFHVDEGEIVSVIGANGAGKTTLMSSITGLVHAASGTITFDGRDITKMQPHKIVRHGITYVPEGRLIFPELTVYENLLMGAYSCKYSKQDLDQLLEEQYTLFPKLKQRLNQNGGSLSGGEQQMLAISRGLMSSPKLLMLDEPSLGLAPIIVEDIFKTILHIREMKKIPIVLVEQNAFMALDASDRAYVLELGTMRMEGRAKELMESPEIKKAYLGG